MNRLDNIENLQIKDSIPDFQPGDNIRVHVRIQEGAKERLQAYEGVVIARKHGGIRETVTVRKISFGVGVERIFPLHATIIDHIEVTRRGRVRRAKLYYLRDLRGKPPVSKNAIPGRTKKLKKLPKLNRFWIVDFWFAI